MNKIASTLPSQYQEAVADSLKSLIKSGLHIYHHMDNQLWQDKRQNQKLTLENLKQAIKAIF